jgi:structure-specific recognition protein 1
LYPLERAFFYVHKPPLLLLHEDVESVEFCRQGGGGAASTKTFDLAIRDRADQVHSLAQHSQVYLKSRSLSMLMR